MWTHSSLTWKGKLKVFTALIESKLFYSLGSMALTAAQQRRIDGFQNRCVRKIIGVKPAYISRVSNGDVLKRSGHTQASLTLRSRRLQLFGKVLRAPSGHPLRQACFVDDTLHPLADLYVRRVGRPSQEWTKQVLKDCIRFFGSIQNASQAAQNKSVWDDIIHKLIYE